MKSTLSITIAVTSALISQFAFADAQSNIRSQQNITNEVEGGTLAVGGAFAGYGSYRFIKQFSQIDSPKLQRINAEIDQLNRVLAQESPSVLAKERALQAAKKLHSIEGVNEAIRTTKQLQSALGSISSAQSLVVIEQAGANVNELTPILAKLQGSLDATLNDQVVSAQQKRQIIAQAQAELDSAKNDASAETKTIEYELEKHESARAKFFRDAARATRGSRFLKLGSGALLGVVSAASVGSSGFIAYTVMVDGATPRPATAEETLAIVGNSVAIATATK